MTGMDEAPLRTGKKGPTRYAGLIEHAEHPSPHLALLRVRLNDPGFHFVPGQFTYIYHQTNGAEERRPYSIANAPADGPGLLEFAVKSVAPEGVADWIGHRKPAERVELSAALGTFRFVSPPGRPVVFLATGTGVAPLRAMLHELWAKGDDREAWLFLGSSQPEGLPYDPEFVREAERRGNFHYVPTLSRAGTYEWNGKRGWIQEPFLEEFRHRKDFDAYVCGVRRMVDDVVQLLKSRGLEDAQIHFERYV